MTPFNEQPARVPVAGLPAVRLFSSRMALRRADLHPSLWVGPALFHPIAELTE